MTEPCASSFTDWIKKRKEKPNEEINFVHRYANIFVLSGGEKKDNDQIGPKSRQLYQR